MCAVTYIVSDRRLIFDLFQGGVVRPKSLEAVGAGAGAAGELGEGGTEPPGSVGKQLPHWTASLTSRQ